MWKTVASTHIFVLSFFFHDHHHHHRAAVADGGVPPLPPPPPLRVYLLVGQSNMEGKGSVEHLERLWHNELTKSTYRHYFADGGNRSSNSGTDRYATKENVYIHFQDDQVYEGPLRVGYGYPADEAFGPELEFGWIVGTAAAAGAAAAQDVLLIKCAWGGKSLAVDFRSPSGGIGNYTHCNDGDNTHYNDGNENYRDGNDGSDCRPYKPSQYGAFYRRTIDTVRSVLQNLPVINGKRHDRYELAGMVWFQGWNDLIDDQMVGEYKDNLIRFVRDARLDLNEPGLPIVVGELGQGGPVVPPPSSGGQQLPHALLRRQMRLAAQEFPASATYVMTSPYVNSEGESFNGDYHYYGRADTFFYIGRAFGTAMLQLVETNPPTVRKVERAAPRNEWLARVNQITTPEGVGVATITERRRRKTHTLLNQSDGD